MGKFILGFVAGFCAAIAIGARIEFRRVRADELDAELARLVDAYNAEG